MSETVSQLKIDCQYLRKGKFCAMAEQLSGVQDVDVEPVHCEACLRQPVPRGPNKMTASIAYKKDKSCLPRVRHLLRGQSKVQGPLPPIPDIGPGTELRKMIGRLGFKITKTCRCRQHIVNMNFKGPDWCEKHVDLIVGWLEQESRSRKLGWDPIRNAVAHRMVKRAIRRARKKSQQKPQPEDEGSLAVFDRNLKKTTALRNILAGGVAFLLCGGPSTDCLPIERLAERGYWSMAVNNMAAHPRIRPQAFICADPPLKFHHSIWWDPGIMKFIPECKFEDGGNRNILRQKIRGEFVVLEEKTYDAPNVWAYRRRSWLVPDQSFFGEDGAAWGNNKHGHAVTGLERVVCTMLCGIRLIHYLGARTIFLVGVDFSMPDVKGAYSFPQKGHPNDRGTPSNNDQYPVVNRWLCKMSDSQVFEKAGLQILNTNRFSGLRAFPFMPFDRALDIARGRVDQNPDLSYWYEKAPRDPDCDA